MRPALLLCALAFTLAACGAEPRDSAEEFTGAERAVAAAVEKLESAARDDDSTEVCTKLFSAQLLATLKERRKNCTAAVEDAFKDDDSLDLTVEDVTINASTATAKITSGRGDNERTDTLRLEKAGAAWRISSL